MNYVGQIPTLLPQIPQQIGRCLQSALDQEITKKVLTVLGVVTLTAGSLALSHIAPASVGSVFLVSTTLSCMHTFNRVQEYMKDLAANKNPSIAPMMKTAFVTVALFSSQLLAIQMISFLEDSYSFYRAIQVRDAVSTFYSYNEIMLDLAIGMPMAIACMKATRFFFNFMTNKEGSNLERVKLFFQYLQKKQFSRAFILLEQDIGMLNSPAIRRLFGRQRLLSTLQSVIPAMSEQELRTFLDSLTENEVPLSFLINSMTNKQIQNVYLKKLSDTFEKINVAEINRTCNTIERDLLQPTDLETAKNYLSLVNKYAAALSRAKSIKRSFGKNFAELRAIQDNDKKRLIQTKLKGLADHIDRLHKKLTNTSSDGIRTKLISTIQSLTPKDVEDDLDDPAYEVLGEKGIFTTADCKEYARILGLEIDGNAMMKVSKTLEELGLGTRRQLIDAEVLPKKGERLSDEQIKERLIAAIQTAPSQPSIVESMYHVITGVTPISAGASSMIKTVDRAASYTLFVASDLAQYALIGALYPRHVIFGGVMAAAAVYQMEKDGKELPNTGLRTFRRARLFSNSSWRGRIRMLASESVLTRLALGWRLVSCLIGHNLGRALMRETRPLRGRISHYFSSR